MSRFRGRLHRILLVLSTILSSLATTRCINITGIDADERGFEVWLIDQSDTRGKNFGGTRADSTCG
jgi:hypothetical protein